MVKTTKGIKNYKFKIIKCDESYIIAILIMALSLLNWAEIKAETDTSTRAFSERVKTLRVENPDNFMSPPVIRLGSQDRVDINFDIIGESHEWLRCRLVHCNADWQPSRLLDTEITDGFNEMEVNDYAYSVNTYVHYVNYNIQLPSPKLTPTASGNYLLQVYPEGEPDNLLLQARFYVAESGAGISAGVTTNTDRGFNTEWQQLEIAVDTDAAGIRNPYQDLIIAIEQNREPETAKRLIHPLRVEGGRLTFAHTPELIFPAGNEYRRFETVRADYPGMNVDSVKFGGSNWHAWVAKDYPRTEKEYTYDRTQRGRYKIADYTSTDPNLGADYVTVHFTLAMPELPGKEVYVDGDLTNHQYVAKNRMTYNRELQQYECGLPLKQGSYNYRYAARDKQTGSVTAAPVEGNKYETDNEYQIMVYHREPGSRGDRLIGFLVTKCEK